MLERLEKTEIRGLTDRIWQNHEAQFSRLYEEQAAERQHEWDQQFAATRSISFAMAKASLIAERAGVANAEVLKAEMAAWRARNPGRDFGRRCRCIKVR